MKEFIKNRLKEHFTMDLLEDMMMGEDYPSNFNLDEFKTLKTFKDRIQYCEANLKRISSGSGRIVYMIDDKMVLKLSKNQKGVAQTATEAEWGTDTYFSDILAHTFDVHPDDLWIEMELARKVTKNKFKEIVGCDILQMQFYLQNEHARINGKSKPWRQDPELTEQLHENEFVQSIFEFMNNTGSGVGDYGRLSSYGLVQRNGVDDIVIVDFGLTSDVYDSYYR